MTRDGYIRDAHAFYVVYSISNAESFRRIPMICEHVLRVKESTETPTAVPFVIVGNKADMENDRVVTYEEGEELSNWGPFFETSAKTNTNVKESFFELVREIRRRPELVRSLSKKKKTFCLLL
jgi:GTPase SAR1 family protein